MIYSNTSYRDRDGSVFSQKAYIYSLEIVSIIIKSLIYLFKIISESESITESANTSQYSLKQKTSTLKTLRRNEK